MSVRPFAIATAAVSLGIAVQSASAQGAIGNRPTFGIMAGANLASAGGDDVPDDLKRRNGFIAGGFANFNLGAGGLGIRPELLYSQKGVKGEIDEGSDVDLTLKLDYIEVPVLLKWEMPTGMLRPFIGGGPAFGYQVKCRAAAESDGVSLSADCEDDEDSERKMFEMSGVATAGVAIQLGRQSLLLGGRYSHGFTDLFEDASATNRVWSFFAGFAF